MKNIILRKAILTIMIAALLLGGTAGHRLYAAELQPTFRMANIFTDHMVLQRDQPLPIWGWAAPGRTVTVEVGPHSARTRANAEGRWRVTLPPLGSGKGPLTMTVKAGQETIQLTDILVGEVWLCSGQSNMEMAVSSSEFKAAKHPNIRIFSVPRDIAIDPQDDIVGQWQACSPETIGGFSAVAYYFGREIHQSIEVPVGLINSSWGGSIIEAWTRHEEISRLPDMLERIAEIQDILHDPASSRTSHAHPTLLYNAMINPIVPFAIRGATWYQGESNNGDGMLYFDKMQALIQSWRNVFLRPDAPFYFVQIAPYRYVAPYGDGQGTLPLLWEAQSAALAIPHTGMAVISDIGNVANIHPSNKLDVGKRLALWALAKDYGQDDLVYSGPLYNSMAIEAGKIRLSFDHTGSGLASRDAKPLDWFEIAGEDGKFVKAQAVIDGNTIVVSSDAIAKPTAARFAWDQVAQPNLINKEGLPAGPFRTHRP